MKIFHLIRCATACGITLSLITILSGCSSTPTTAPSSESMGPPLFTNLGTLQYDITTKSPKAQKYFNQGLRLIFAFNHEEAIASFEKAARLDPEAAMAYWGSALALGPNINLPMSPQAEQRAYAEIQKALALVDQVSPQEQGYIKALATRYSNKPNSNEARTALDTAYAEAMQELWYEYPEDTHVGTLFAESMMDLQPWDFWTADGKPKENAVAIVSTLERVLSLDPDHPGACHYYIHTVEASLEPERALPCADKLHSLMPGAGHLVHMPAHIYLRLGMYEKAVERNQAATTVDHDYLAHRDLKGIYPAGYYPHNVHFLWSALTMEGRKKEALEAAANLQSLVSWETARTFPLLEEFTPTYLFALTRFGQWDEILTIPAPPSELRYTTAIRHYARGIALATYKRFDEASKELTILQAVVDSIPNDQTIGTGKVKTLARVAGLVLAGEIQARQGNYDQAITHLQEAVTVEDSLRYYEPPLWHYPVRHSLGAVLLQAQQPQAAERAYREDLRQHPHNGWALYGLTQSLTQQNKEKEADKVRRDFKAAWARADVTLSSSRF